MCIYSASRETNGGRSDGERMRTDEAVMECPRGGIKGIVYTGFTESGDEI